MKPTLVQALLIAKARGATKVRMADAHQILGTAELAAPQWIPLDNYEVKLPESYVASILADSKQLGRFESAKMLAIQNNLGDLCGLPCKLRALASSSLKMDNQQTWMG